MNIFRRHVYKCRMSNGAQFQFNCWDLALMDRDQLKERFLEIANGDYEGVYTKDDIEYIWRTNYGNRG